MKIPPESSDLHIGDCASEEFCTEWDSARIALREATTKDEIRVAHKRFDALLAMVNNHSFPRRDTSPDTGPRKLIVLSTPRNELPIPKGFWGKLFRWFNPFHRTNYK